MSVASTWAAVRFRVYKYAEFDVKTYPIRTAFVVEALIGCLLFCRYSSVKDSIRLFDPVALKAGGPVRKCARGADV